jgi:hypothetical protein
MKSADVLFQELEYVLTNRQTKPSVFQIFKACFAFASKHRYVEIFRCLDRLLLGGKLLQTLAASSYKIYFVSLTRKDKYEDSASTQYNHKTFIITLRLPDVNEMISMGANVGGVICTRETCLIALIAHEFVHVLEIVLRLELKVFSGFTTVDRKNIIFTEWLKILFAQQHDRNII